MKKTGEVFTVKWPPKSGGCVQVNWYRCKQQIEHRRNTWTTTPKTPSALRYCIRDTAHGSFIQSVVVADLKRWCWCIVGSVKRAVFSTIDSSFLQRLTPTVYFSSSPRRLLITSFAYASQCHHYVIRRRIINLEREWMIIFYSNIITQTRLIWI